jgi:hypothetical protein
VEEDAAVRWHDGKRHHGLPLAGHRHRGHEGSDSGEVLSSPTITTVVLAAAAADPTRADSPASSGVVVWKPPPSPDSADSVDLGEPRNLCRHLEQRRGTGTKSRKAEEAARRRLQS